MISEVKVDGIYRPEQEATGTWLVVAFIGFRGTINRKVHCETYRGRTLPARYDSAIEADKVCKQLNNEQPKGKVGANINDRDRWRDSVRCESTGQIKYSDLRF